MLPQLYRTNDQQNAEKHWVFFPLVTAKLTYRVKLQLSFIKGFVLIQFIAFESPPPPIMFLPSAKGHAGLGFSKMFFCDAEEKAAALSRICQHAFH